MSLEGPLDCTRRGIKRTHAGISLACRVQDCCIQAECQQRRLTRKAGHAESLPCLRSDNRDPSKRWLRDIQRIPIRTQQDSARTPGYSNRPAVFVKKPERVIALPLRDGALLVGVSAGRAPAASPISGNGPNHCQKGSTNRPTAPRCAGFSNVLRALISCTSAVVHAGTPRYWGCRLFISRFFVCLVLYIRNSIFSLPKLRNVGYMVQYLCWTAECNANKEEICFLLKPGSATGKNSERPK